MANWHEMAAKLAKLAETMAPLIVPGAGPIIAAGKVLLDTVDEFKVIAGSTTPELEAARGELETRVLAHLEDTAASLD